MNAPERSSPIRNATRILIVTRHYPPLISGGARRPFLLAAGLRALGHDVGIVAPKLPEGETGLAVDHVVHVHEAPDLTENGVPVSGSSTQIRDALRTHLLIPDPDIRWSLAAYRQIQRSDFENPGWILTTSPPESIHSVGFLLSIRSGRPWIADLRDNWLEHPLLPVRRHGLRRMIERPIARTLLRHARLVTAPTKTILTECEQLGASNTLLLPQPAPPAATPFPGRTDDTVRLLHTGSFSLSDDGRDIGSLLQLFSAARARGLNVSLELVGRLTDRERAAALAAGAETHSPVAMTETWALQRSADILILVASENTEAVPGKLAEYVASGRPVICIGGGAWRASVPGADRTPLNLLAELQDAEARESLARKQSPLTRSPTDVASTLVRAMEAVL